MNFNFEPDRFRDSVLELIRKASCELPVDVVQAMEKGRDSEAEGSAAKSVLSYMLKNARAAQENSTPICQDTGTNIYFITIPEGVSLRKVEQGIVDATRIATEKSYLRPNAVDSVTGRNSGDNTGIMAPYYHFEEWDEPVIKVEIVLKGGGCENVSDQYKLPNNRLKADRDIDGVYKCIIDAINNAQGLGCAPGVVGIGIGGDRASGMIIAKKQLFRKLPDVNPDRELQDLEERLFKDLNTLGIGPMGFGGGTTVLGVKVGSAHRLPASFFVSISYMCWADRRKTLLYSEGEVDYD
ncbi:MAG: fumarate hydratase [Candidatus Neomarinimicrobiota bacterium]